MTFLHIRYIIRQVAFLHSRYIVLMLRAAGDHLYRMNYQDFVLAHRKTGADITVAALPTDEKKATAFGLMKIDGSGRIVDFAEKPKGEALHAMRVDTTILGLDAERCAPHIRDPVKGLPSLLSSGSPLWRVCAGRAPFTCCSPA